MGVSVWVCGDFSSSVNELESRGGLSLGEQLPRTQIPAHAGTHTPPGDEPPALIDPPVPDDVSVKRGGLPGQVPTLSRSGRS